MLKIIRKTLFIAMLSLVVLIAVLLINTILYTPASENEAALVKPDVDVEKAVTLLSQAIGYRTVSAAPEAQQFQDYLAWLKTVFPQLYEAASVQIIGNLTPLFIWQGSDATIKPVILSAHYDVVPVPEDSLNRWTHPPFSGRVADGYIWGRGSLDNKGAMIALMQSAEDLIASGFRPKRTIIFSFGYDEEIGGKAGAGAVTAYLKSRGITAQWSLDEGSFVLQDMIAGLVKPVASVNVAEKGMLSLHLIATGQGGHSSMPPPETAVGILATAIDKLQRQPVPGGLSGTSRSFFEELGRHFSFGRRILFANMWLFRPLLESVLESKPTTNAVLRTTTAPTMLSGSPAENVLATTARATVNFRIHPRDSIASIVAFVEEVIADDRIQVEISDRFRTEPSAQSSVNSDGFQAIEHAVRIAFSDAVTVPGLTIAGTDSKHYQKVADNAYRFNPFRITPEDLPGIHGINERVSIENLRGAMVFYTGLIQSQ